MDKKTIKNNKIFATQYIEFQKKLMKGIKYEKDEKGDTVPSEAGIDKMIDNRLDVIAEVTKYAFGLTDEDLSRMSVEEWEEYQLECKEAGMLDFLTPKQAKKKNKE